MKYFHDKESGPQIYIETFVGNKAKGRISKRVFHQNKVIKSFGRWLVT